MPLREHHGWGALAPPSCRALRDWVRLGHAKRGATTGRWEGGWILLCSWLGTAGQYKFYIKYQKTI